MTEQIPEGGWPSIPVVAPYDYEVLPEFTSGLVDMSDEAAIDEVLQFYKDQLVPQLACDPTGTFTPHPQEGWVKSKDPQRVIVEVRADGVLCGAWILRDGQIYFPCADPAYVAPIFRALWDETIKHFDYVWTTIKNPLVLAFANKAVRVPRSANSPYINGDRLEWRRVS